MALGDASTALFGTVTAADFAFNSGFEIPSNRDALFFAGVGYLPASSQPDYFGFGSEAFFSCNQCRHAGSDGNNTPARWTWTISKPAGKTRIYVSMLLASSIATSDGFEPTDLVELKLGVAEVLKTSLQAVGDGGFEHLSVDGRLLEPTAHRFGKIVTVDSAAATLTLQLTVVTTSATENIAFGSLKVHACEAGDTGTQYKSLLLSDADVDVCHRSCRLLHQRVQPWHVCPCWANSFNRPDLSGLQCWKIQH